MRKIDLASLLRNTSVAGIPRRRQVMKRLVLIPLVAFLAGMPAQADVASHPLMDWELASMVHTEAAAAAAFVISMVVLTAGPIVFTV